MRKKGNNVFNSALYALGISHTQKFSNKYYSEHPHKYNLFGISQMLSDYGINNAGIRIANKSDDIAEIECPFIAQVGGSFAVVYGVDHKLVEYRVGDLNFKIDREDFCEAWSGVALLLESNPGSIEPGYRDNHRDETINFCLKAVLSLFVAIFLFLLIVRDYQNFDFGTSLSLFINILGLSVGWMLIQKQLEIHSSYTDRICSILKQADCNDILKSDEAKILGVVSWSEVGFSYFLSNLIVIVFFKHLLFFYAIVNLCVLPFTLWSIWFQKFKIKQWCVLCLLVQVLLWSVFITNLMFEHFYLTDFKVTDVIILFCVYLIPIPALTLFLQFISKLSKIENIIQEINSLKSNEGLLASMLKEQPHYPSEIKNSEILFGNKKAKVLITILTNPHCPPCAYMHSRVESLLKSNPNGICIQYIFSSFGPGLDISNKFLIAIYQNNNELETAKIYQEWFETGKLDKESFFEKFQIDVNSKEVTHEFEKHKNWITETQLQITPTIMVNGYKLPLNYQIEDLRYLTELNI
ncbi:vitamin K epoxide reductase family protein [Pedobacter sp. KACC 23697]|uniref:Thioredoxin domain-containing protein n=1 Tax=Pedobacter sp. KACC 23697 TaxID=3149230 RepID=A0AAU7K9G4_9SPHI